MNSLELTAGQKFKKAAIDVFLRAFFVVVVVGLFFYFYDWDSEGAARARSAAAQAQQAQLAEAARLEKLEPDVQARRVVIGMSADQVRRAWGEPTKINVTTTAAGRDEQWVYRAKDAYVFFSGGVVRSVHESR